MGKVVSGVFRPLWVLDVAATSLCDTASEPFHGHTKMRRGGKARGCVK